MSVPLILMVLVLGVWFFLLRTRSTRLSSKQQFDAIISGGRPAVVDFFSNT